MRRAALLPVDAEPTSADARADAARRRLLRGGLLWPLAPVLLSATPAHADLADVVAAVRPSLVPVGTFSATESPRFGFRGTGFAVGDGTLVATNHHVLPEGGEAAVAGRRLVVHVRTPGTSRGGGSDTGELRPARIVAADRSRDLALLRIEGAPLAPLTLAADDAAREGQSIALMGYPIGGALGFAPVTHRGIIASITTVALPAPTAAQLDPRAIARLREGNFEVLQLDATAYPGNSGGPLFDAASGRVLGVVSMVLVKGSRESAIATPTGITYAVPVRHLRALLDEAAAGSEGRMTRPATPTPEQRR
jgi:S1-C subfamily serine protease